MITAIILFLAGFALLAKGADLLVDGSVAIAKRYNVSELIIGLTIVSFGTSLPEVFVNVYASYKGNTDLAIANVVGSSIANLLLILGMSGAFLPFVVDKQALRKQLPFSLFAIGVFALAANDLFISEGVTKISRLDGLLFIALLVGFMFRIYKNESQKKHERISIAEMEYPQKSSVALLLGGIACLTLGSRWVVDGGVTVAKWFGVSEALIGLTLLSFGTALPELVTVIAAAMKRKSDLVLGNVIGSNIFNLFWVIGLSAMVNPIPYSKNINVFLIILACSTVLTLFWILSNKLRMFMRWHGIINLMLYALYILFTFYH